MNIAEIVRTYRESKKMSQHDFAKRLKIPPVVLSYLEDPEQNGESLIGYLASALKTTPQAIKGETPAVVPQKAQAVAPPPESLKIPEPAQSVAAKKPAEAPIEKTAEIAPKKQAEKPADKSITGATVEKFKAIPKLTPKPVEAPASDTVNPVTYPSIRKFLLDPLLCRNPRDAEELVLDTPFSPTERQIVLYLSTVALYNFCDTTTSHFAFEKYLTALHGTLLSRLEKELATTDLPAEEKTERLREARSNIFYCERVEAIAGMVLEKFAVELEEKLQSDDLQFGDDLHLPFSWDIDAKSKQITIRDSEGAVLEEIALKDTKMGK